MNYKKCKNCGIKMVVKNSRKTFCSQHCRKTYMLKQQKPIKKICINCNNEFETKNDKVIFCSIGCATSYRHRDPTFKQKHSDAMKKIRESTEYKNKQSRSQKIAQNNEYTKRKRSASLTSRWAETEFKEMMLLSRSNSKILKSKEFKEEECKRNKEISNRKTVSIAKTRFNRIHHNKSYIVESKRAKMIAYWADPQNLINRIDHSHGAYYEYKFPSGNIVKVQGYEPQALDILINKYKETDIISGTKNIILEIGPIRYFYENNEYTYYPDIYIKSINTIIEVKSQWTFDKWKEKNLAKEQACLQQGFNFEFMIL